MICPDPARLGIRITDEIDLAGQYLVRVDLHGQPVFLGWASCREKGWAIRQAAVACANRIAVEEATRRKED